MPSLMEENLQYYTALLEYFSNFMTDTRMMKFRSVVGQRTRYLTVVLEDIYQSHNISAVLRSCECMGVQDVHIIENDHPYEINPDIALGASKWLSIYHYNESEKNTEKCLRHLKSTGYTIVATTPHEHDCMIDDLPDDQPAALLFGTEVTGLSRDALNMADRFVRIPMYGFTESYNISVTAALAIQHFMNRLRAGKHNWQLTETEKIMILIDWARASIKSSEAIEREFRFRFKT